VLLLSVLDSGIGSATKGLVSTIDPTSEPVATTHGGDSLRRTAVRGTLWTVGGFGLGQVLRLVANIILAAVLFQDAFALMGLVGAVVQGLVMFSDIGIAQSIVQNPRGDERRFLDTAWTLQAIRGAALAIIATLLAWPMAAFYAANDPRASELRFLLPIVAVGSLLEGLQSTKMKTAGRHIQLARVTVVELSSQVIGLMVTVGMALATRSVYALAFGSLAGMGSHALLSHIVLPGPNNRFAWDAQCAKEIVRFGRWVLASTVVTFFAMQLDKLVFARLFPLAVVGVYNIAANLAALTPTVLGRVQLTIMFPYYSRLLQNNVPLPEVVRKAKFPMLVAGGYLVALSVAGAPDFVRLVYDDRYLDAGVYIPILSVGAWFSMLEGVYGASFLASGRAQWVASVNLVRVVLFALLVWPMVSAFSMLGAVSAMALADLGKVLLAIILGRTRGLKDQWVDFLFTLYVCAIGLGAMAIPRYGPPVLRSNEVVPLVIEFLVVTGAFAPFALSAFKDHLPWNKRRRSPEATATVT